MPSANFTLPASYTLPTVPPTSHPETSTTLPSQTTTTESQSRTSQPPPVEMNVRTSKPEHPTLPSTLPSNASAENSTTFPSRILDGTRQASPVSVEHNALPTSVSHIPPPPGIYRLPTPAERALPAGDYHDNIFHGPEAIGYCGDASFLEFPEVINF